MTVTGAPQDTIVAATATCPIGKVLLGGGGRVEITGTTAQHKAVLQRSYPTSPTTWTAFGVVMDNLTLVTESIEVQAFAICSP